MNVLNLLKAVVPSISILTPPRAVVLHVLNFSDKIVDGRYIATLEKEIEYNAIIQQDSSANINKLSESTVDTTFTFKVFLLTDTPLIVNSENKIEYKLCFEDPIGSGISYMHNVYNIENYTMNGWIACNASRIDNSYDNYKK